MNTEKKVAIILCTYNGEEFLSKQLDSIIEQTYTNWVIFASDDYSSDSTTKILSTYQRQVGNNKFIILTGPKKGFAWNFLHALTQCEGFDYYAFCDQDDIWVDDKIENAVKFLSQSDAAIPAIHCGRTALIDENDHCFGKSYLFKREPSFKNALMQNIAGGNTMLFNVAAHKLLVRTPKNYKVISHDWWAYILITGCGGNIYYDPEPKVLYRQHGKNIIGSNISTFSKLLRVKKLVDGQFRQWNECNLSLLEHFESDLTDKNKKTLSSFKNIRDKAFILRVYFFLKEGFYRQTWSGTIALIFGVFLKRI
ncbi:glycosyltransferase family 2 protein [Atlantibacter hermannii]|uniref:glycosyltransferase family 2 protein n=1 Tax=Atlantibacter hermannii TaxID=565 RepID=UPI00254BFCE0|nr:glycosyltransferase family 2 protein [Atlantibacter hermannii]